MSESVSATERRVFLCHASGDKEQVRQLYRQLSADGFNPWLDEEDLLPGQDWELEIRKAVRGASIVLVCLSNKSVTKTGYVQKEIRIALDAADERPEGAIYIIPIRLEQCEVPNRLSTWQWVDMFDENGYKRLLRSLRSHFGERATSESQAVNPRASDDAGFRIEARLGNTDRGLDLSPEPHLMITVINDSRGPLSVPSGIVELTLEDEHKLFAIVGRQYYVGLPNNYVLAEAERFTVAYPHSAWKTKRAEGVPAATGIMLEDGRGRTYKQPLPPEVLAWFN